MNLLKKSVLVALAAGYSFSLYAQTSHSQGPKNWHLKDKQKDGVHGISLDKAYEFVKGKKGKTVVVAVIDSGIDTLHEDLRPVLWTNPKEIAGNGVDDDKNGYVDDVHGWNFIGGRDGRNVKANSDEASRVYHRYRARFENLGNPASLNAEDKFLYDMWKRSEQQVVGGPKLSGMELVLLQRTYATSLSHDSLLQKAMGKAVYTGTELEAFTPATEDARKAKNAFLFFFTTNKIMEETNESFLEQFKSYLDSEEQKAVASDRAPKDLRGEIVGDNYNDINDRFYGNNDIMANTPLHGTHVAGIIAAARNNGKGMDGVADNVQIMSVRVVPDGDEYDKDVALAIRYAVDNGARVINMSFGKGYSPEKKWVDDAVRYAQSKGVLLVHAAGNDGSNIDTVHNYPSPVLLNDGSRMSSWITVGASGDAKAGGLVAYFSNYGKKEVDVFAPGMNIYSTVPGGNTYGPLSGTSMAAPVVSGVAAFLMSYFPELSAEQIKQVIEKSAVNPGVKVTGPGEVGPVDFAELSRTGGLVNAFEAAKLAASMQGQAPKATPAPKKKPVIKKTPRS